MMEKQKRAHRVAITVRNKLSAQKRVLNVYHHSRQTSHLISSNRTLTCQLNTGEDIDYLHISVTSGPGYLKKNCLLDLPPFMRYQFLSVGNFDLDLSCERIKLKIPPGPPSWELKLTIPNSKSACGPLTADQVTIGDV